MKQLVVLLLLLVIIMFLIYSYNQPRELFSNTVTSSGMHPDTYQIVDGMCQKVNTLGPFRSMKTCNEFKSKNLVACNKFTLAGETSCFKTNNFGYKEECVDCDNGEGVPDYRIRVLDFRNGNVLLRGPQMRPHYYKEPPNDDGTTPEKMLTDDQYDHILDVIKFRIKQFDLPVPLNYDFLDVCLSTPGESTYPAEQNYFDKYPEKGTFIWNNIVGIGPEKVGELCKASEDNNYMKPRCYSFRPQDFPEDERKEIARNFNNWATEDQLEKYIDSIYALMSKKYRSPKIIYFHCASGKDRTGTLALAYSLKYLGYTWEEAFCNNLSVIPDVDYSLVTYQMWFAEYLKTQGYANIGTVEIPESGFKCPNDQVYDNNGVQIPIEYNRDNTCDQCEIPFDGYQRKWCSRSYDGNWYSWGITGEHMKEITGELNPNYGLQCGAYLSSQGKTDKESIPVPNDGTKSHQLRGVYFRP